MTNDEKDLGEEAWWEEGPSVVNALREDAPAVLKPVYDLEERTARFGEAIVLFAKKIPYNPVNNRLIVNWSVRRQALVPIIARPTMVFLGRIS